MYIFKAGVVGAGFMGAEIAQVISYSGLPVVLKDIDQEFLDKGLDRIRGIYQTRVDKGKMDISTLTEKMDLIQGTLTYDDFEDVDIVIEAVPEKMDLKKQVLQELEEVCPESTIFASNTTALSVSEMGAATEKPHKMVGMHFFSPAHIMKLVEVIPGLDTSEETVNDVVMFSESLRKIPVVVQECPGFLVNRLLMAYLNEAALCLEEGAATEEETDEAMVKFGWPMGPFTLMDMIGTDICYVTGKYLTAEYGERLHAAKIFEKLYQAGRSGEKTGAGFYGYGDQTDEPVKEMIKEIQSQPGAVTGTEFSPDRLMMPLINEAVLCLQEHVASASDIDMAAIAGIGMKMGDERMGPLAMADRIGLDVVLEKLEQFKEELGARFHPARLLRLHVRAGHLGDKTVEGFLALVG
ncbi:MAG: 3-hydroxyacyl-CoA dehydrogenase [Anaerolineales bacterium]|nr:MAG: 3-hydroxyacyl-CoA dehydrogenase [Anaerolineales bacterium]